MAGKTRVGESKSTIARYIQNVAKEYAQWNESGRTDSEAGHNVVHLSGSSLDSSNAGIAR